MREDYLIIIILIIFFQKKAPVTRTDWNIRMVGNGAYVIYTKKDKVVGITSHFYESRFMENGWTMENYSGECSGV